MPLLFIVILLPLGCSQSGIEFPDPVLEDAIRNAFGGRRGPLLADNVEALRALTVEKGVTRLDGIEYCKSLRTLRLGMSVLSEGKVNTYVNHFTDITPLAALVHLEVLDLNHNPVSDMSPLQTLSKLECLDFSHTNVSDPSVLSNLNRLRELRLVGAPIDDLSFLETIPWLETLWVGGKEYSNIDAIATVKSLKTLHATNCGLEDITFLTELPVLENLFLGGNPIKDFTVLSKLEYLKNLDIGKITVDETGELLPPRKSGLRHD